VSHCSTGSISYLPHHSRGEKGEEVRRAAGGTVKRQTESKRRGIGRYKK